MIPEPALKKLVEAIHSDPAFSGCMVGFQGNNQSRVLHAGAIPGSKYNRIVIIEEISAESAAERKGKARPVMSSTKNGSGAVQVTDTPPFIVTNKSMIGSELVGTGLSCGLAVISGIGVLGGAAAELPTGGASTLLIIAAWTGFVTSGAQCVNGLVRTATAYLDPEDNDLQRWDENSMYSITMLVVDALGVVSSVVSLPAASRNLIAVFQRHGKLKQSAEALVKMNRSARGVAVRDAIREASKTPEGRKAVELALKESKLTAKQAANVMKSGADSARRSRVVVGAIQKDAAVRLNAALRDVLGGYAGIGVSGTPQAWTGSGSGSMNALGSWAGNTMGSIVVHVMEI